MTTEGKVSPLPLPISVRSHGPATRMCDLYFAEGLAGHIQIWRNGVLGTQEEIDAFAAFIVRAVNAHDRLVAALETMLMISDFELNALYTLDELAELRAALAAAKEGK